MTEPSFLVRLDCSDCDRQYQAGRRHGLCDCGRPLLPRYDLERAARTVDRDRFHPEAGLWQWRPVLPLPESGEPVTLGEGGTPLLDAGAFAARAGLEKGRLLVKDEGVNPTASFKARGLSAAVTMARHLGADRLVVPTAGNAGGALAAYAARAGLRARVIMPRDAPFANRVEVEAHGAELERLDGLITDCGRRARELATEDGWYDVSTLKEPYRLEGKKTMGYELACQLGWRLPDVILYPTGGGTGLIGMWKAFAEMEALGWIGSDRPRMVSVQAAGCAPVVRAFEEGADVARPWENAATVAAGLRVPSAVGDKLMLAALRESAGAAVAIRDADLVDAALELSRELGVFAAPEGGACLAALRELRRTGYLDGSEEVVLFNTGSGLKYLEALSVRASRSPGT